MSDAAFLQEILANPDDDSVRLIYADWLEEQGNPRGTFIRTQIALNQETDPARRALLSNQEDLLLVAHEAEWSAAFRRRTVGWTFQRGFIHHIVLRPQRMIAVLDFLSHLTPLDQMRLVENAERTPPMREITWLSMNPVLQRMRMLDLSATHMDSQTLGALSASPYLEGLRHLDLSTNRIGDRGMSTLSTSPFLPHLVTLNLRGNLIAGTGLLDLTTRIQEDLKQGHPMHLQRLDLRGNPLGNTVRRAILRDRDLRRITLLD